MVILRVLKQLCLSCQLCNDLVIRRSIQCAIVEITLDMVYMRVCMILALLLW